MIKIKRIGVEISGIYYITEGGTYLCDTNFIKSTNTSEMALHTLTINNTDGEPSKLLRNIKFEVVDEF